MEDLVKRAGVALTLGLSAFFAVGTEAVYASVLTETVELSSCDNGAYKNCTDTGYVSTTLADANSAFIGSSVVGGSIATFTTAFEAWDAANGDDWTLANGGTLGLTINATIGLSASNTVAGLSPVIFTLSGASASLLSQLVWTQALVVNYSPLAGSLSTLIETLDTFSLSQNGSNPNFPKSCSNWSNGNGGYGKTFCGPIYPFQYGSTLSRYTLDGVQLGVDPFYDAPQGDWPNASFEAITLLSTVNMSTRTLTVYQGVEYGFSLDPTIPEPSTWALLLSGFAALGLFRYAGKRTENAA
jgi:hypothetical protein